MLGKRYESTIQHLKSHAFLYFALFLALSVSLGLLSYGVYPSYTAHSRLVSNGKSVAAVRNDPYTKTTSRTGIRYTVTYTFDLDGRIYSGTSITRSEPTSRNFEVIYDPQDPTNNKMAGSLDSFEVWVDTGKLVLGLVIALAIFLLIYAIFLKVRIALNSRFKPRTEKIKSPKGAGLPIDNRKFRLPVKNIVWLEREILRFNQELFEDDRPPSDANFFQVIPAVLFERDTIRPTDVAEAATSLVAQTLKRLKLNSGRHWDVPFRRPRVEFTASLPGDEPGHIEFGNVATTIRIHPKYSDDPFALSAILCHELAHFILDHNGFRKLDRNENERLTDLFVFKCGQGLIYLQGFHELEGEGNTTHERQLGYLTIEEMAYAHVRCATQFGLSIAQISPNHFRGKGFSEVEKAVSFLSVRNQNSFNLAEIVLCSKNHILRISRDRKDQKIRCPKCQWTAHIWFRKADHLSSLMEIGTKHFDVGEFSEALVFFRNAQEIVRTHAPAYCFASRCLKRQGSHQDAIRELKKFLAICPENQMAQEEMKSLIY